MTNGNRLRGEIVAKYRSVANFARKFEMEYQKTNRIVNNPLDAKTRDVQEILEKLDMDTNPANSGFYLPID